MKVALVTGGSRGIGAATVEQFANNGYSVILNYNKSESEARALQARLCSEGRDVHLFKADVSDIGQIKNMFDFVYKYFKKLDVLVNNAGIAISNQIQDVSEEEYDRIMDTNVKGAFFCCQQALALLNKSNAASIVNVSSIWGIEGASCESVYSMSKHALTGLSRSLAEEFESTNIAVNCICPPIVLTDMSKGYSADEIQEFCKETSTRAYTPTEIAQEIYRLAMSRNNGQILKL